MRKYQVEFLVKCESGLFCVVVDAENKETAEIKGLEKLLDTFPLFKGLTRIYNTVII